MRGTTRKISRWMLVAIAGVGAAGDLLHPREVAAASPVEKLQEFTLDQVQIKDAYYQNLFSKDAGYLTTTIDADRLLAPFKAVSAGQDPSTAPGLNLYGGWEAASSLLRGHTLGHYLSALAHGYQQTKGSDPIVAGQIQVKIDYIITQLKSFQDKSPNGYLFGSPETQFDIVEGKAAGVTWVPWYTMHKVLSGLVDVYEFEGNATALQIASKLGDWTYTRASGWSAATRTKVLGIEYGGMNDCLYELYKLTSSAKHLAAAHVFDETTLFTPVSQSTDVLNGLHANTTIPKFLGALNRYRALGAAESSYFTAADEFWSLVLKNHTFVTGGHGQDEHFHVPGKLDAIRDNVTNESCNAYNMEKLARELFKITGNVKYADYYERTQINEVLSAMNPVTGMTTYFKPMGTGYFKAYGTPDSTFWCCNGTGMENYMKLNDSLYFHDAADLYVIGYVSSTLNWQERGLSLEQVADVALTHHASFNIKGAPTAPVNLKFRKPSWVASCQGVTMTVNGQPVEAVEASGFLSISRIWQSGDKVDLTFPLEVQASRLPDNPNAVAFTYGPIVLSAGLGTAQMTTAAHALTLAATKPAGLQDTIKINAGATINDWIANLKSNLVQTAGKLEFTLKNTDSDGKLTFTPHYQRYQDRYGIYFLLSGAAGGTAPATANCPPTGTGGSGGASGMTGGMAGGMSGVAGGGSGGGSGFGGATEDAGGTAGSLAATVDASGSAGTGGGTGADAHVEPGRSSADASLGDGAVIGSASGGAGDSGRDDASGCSCNLGAERPAGRWALGALVGLGLVAGGRRRRR